MWLLLWLWLIFDNLWLLYRGDHILRLYIGFVLDLGNFLILLLFIIVLVILIFTQGLVTFTDSL